MITYVYVVVIGTKLIQLLTIFFLSVYIYISLLYYTLHMSPYVCVKYYVRVLYYLLHKLLIKPCSHFLYYMHWHRHLRIYANMHDYKHTYTRRHIHSPTHPTHTRTQTQIHLKPMYRGREATREFTFNYKNKPTFSSLRKLRKAYRGRDRAIWNRWRRR